MLLSYYEIIQHCMLGLVVRLVRILVQPVAACTGHGIVLLIN